jgi:hypothetical protein
MPERADCRHVDGGTPGRDIRAVNGYGPRCGCGGKSKLHLTTSLGRVSPATSTFLCASCVEEAIVIWASVTPDQPPYWPGDEDRDEPYERPESA